MDQSKTPEMPAQQPEPIPAPVKPAMPLVLIIALILLAPTTAFLFYQNYQLKQSLNQLNQAPIFLPQPSPTSTPDPTADWKTYTNTTYHFSVKYPSNLLESCNPSPTDDGIRFWKIPWDCPEAHDTPYSVAIIGYERNDYLQFKKNITKTPISSKTITIAGIDSTQNFYKYTNEDGPLASFQESTEIIIPVGINIIVIQQLGSSSGDKYLFDQILSTFKFLDNEVEL